MRLNVDGCGRDSSRGEEMQVGKASRGDGGMDARVKFPGSGDVRDGTRPLNDGFQGEETRIGFRSAANGRLEARVRQVFRSGAVGWMGRVSIHGEWAAG